MALVTLIHATPVAMPPMIDAFAARPDVRLLNLLDEGLLAEISRRGGLSDECKRRMSRQISLAADAGSDAVLTTCNAYSRVVLTELAPQFAPLPVLVVDEPMIRQAMEAESVAVLGTVAAGLQAQQELFETIAATARYRPRVTFTLRADAFERLTAGEKDTHDELLAGEIENLAKTADVIVLAQASMARVLDRLPAGYRERVLSSPALAVTAVTSLLGLPASPADRG